MINNDKKTILELFNQPEKVMCKHILHFLVK